MTTYENEQLYLAEHLSANDHRKTAVYNPNNKPVLELPVIYGFNNGGHGSWWNAALLAEDGTRLGGHLCSNEGYMPHDLGILEGTRSDRHEEFVKHYPGGYRMVFVGLDEVNVNPGLLKAIDLFTTNQCDIVTN